MKKTNWHKIVFRLSTQDSADERSNLSPKFTFKQYCCQKAMVGFKTFNYRFSLQQHALLTSTNGDISVAIYSASSIIRPC